MNSADQSKRHATVELLLPWYLNGTLTADEHADVRQHLERCDNCAAQLDDLRRLRAAAQQPGATPIVPAPRADRLLAALDRRDSRVRFRQRTKLIASAAGVAMVFIAAAWMLAPSPQTPARFETLTSGSSIGASSYVLDIEFEPAVSRATRMRVLESLDALQVDPTTSGERYRVTLELPATSLQELDAQTSRIRDLPEIRSIRVVAMQLPLETQR